MGVPAWIVLIASVVVVVVLIVWFFTGQNPSDGADHGGRTPETRSELFYSDSRPAGPDAEAMTADLSDADRPPPMRPPSPLD
jgi:hypothetical protein